MTSLMAFLPNIPTSMPNLSEISNQLSKIFHVAFGVLQTNDMSSNFVTSTLLPNIDRITESYSTALVVITLLIGSIGCLFGYKLSRLFMTISGFIAGIFAGLIVGLNFFNHSNGTIILCCLVGGLVIAFFSCKIYMAGIFIFCFFLGFVGAANYIQATGNLAFFMATLCGVIIGALALKFLKPVIIIATTFVCGSSASEAIVSLGRKFDVAVFTKSYAPIATFAGVFVIGCLFQFLTTRNEETRKKAKKRRRKKDK